MSCNRCDIEMENSPRMTTCENLQAKQQEKINKLEKQLEEAKGVIEFYADPINHEFDDHRLQEDEEVMEFYEVHDEKGSRLSVQPLNNGLDELCEGNVAGKRARQYFKNKESK